MVNFGINLIPSFLFCAFELFCRNIFQNISKLLKGGRWLFLEIEFLMYLDFLVLFLWSPKRIQRMKLYQTYTISSEQILKFNSCFYNLYKIEIRQTIWNLLASDESRILGEPRNFVYKNFLSRTYEMLITLSVTTLLTDKIFSIKNKIF